MAARRPFRFGTGCWETVTPTEYVASARRIEELGYDIVLHPDHFSEQLAPLPALMAAADATSRLRVGSYVFANDFWHPVVLAKQAATLDLLSGGRFELGLGAGYHPFDYGASGIPFEAPAVRVGRLAEAVQIIKGLFADGPVTFRGAHYTVTELDGTPKPRQRPRPPIFIGGSSRRLLALAAREADIVGLVPSPGGEWIDFSTASLEAVARRVETVRQAAGERLGALELNMLVFDVVVADDRRAAAEQRAAAWGISGEQMLGSPHFLVGTVEQLVEDVRMWRERLGVSYVTVFPAAMEDFAPVVERLAGT